MKKIQEEAEAVLKKTQEEIKPQANRERKKVKEWINDNKVMLSIKDLVFKKRPARKLVDWYVGLYHWQNSFYQCDQVMITDFNKDLSSCEH